MTRLFEAHTKSIFTAASFAAGLLLTAQSALAAGPQSPQSLGMAQPQTTFSWTPSPISITTTLEFTGKTVDDTNQSGRIAGLGATARFRDALDENFLLSVEGGVIFEAGSYESHFADEYKPSNRLTLTEASVGWKPGPNFLLKAGALDQSFHDSLLLNDSGAFPGVFEEWRSESHPVFAALTFEQAAPTTNTSSTLPTETEPLPYYEVERLKLGTEMGDAATLSGTFAHFGYHNLTRGVANDSRLLGNSVEGTGPQGAFFVHGYDGFLAGAKLELATRARFRPAIGGTFLINTQAPQGQNQGYLGYVQADIQVAANTVLTPSANLFHNESDSSVAYYNSVDWGHNNRQGVALALKAEFKKTKLALEGNYVRSSLLDVSNPFQSDFNGIFFSLRKAYDLL